MSDNPSLDIENRYQAAKMLGVDLGAPVGGLIDAGYGGQYRVYEHGRIYRHPQVGTYEIHGVVLDKYLRLGANDVMPGTGVRAFGFPSSDVRPTADGLWPASEFEWGAIFGLDGGVAMYGAFYSVARTWRQPNWPLGAGPLGYPIHDPIVAAGGTAMYFERGALWQEPGGSMVTVTLSAPPLGRPELVNAGGPSAPLPIIAAASFSAAQWSGFAAARPQLLAELFHGRLMLRAVTAAGAPAMEIPLEAGGAQLTSGTTNGVTHYSMQSNFSAAPGAPGLAERTLYDLVLKRADGTTHVIAPHALYNKQSWESFELIHATDIHVSARLESFRARLAAVPYPDGVAGYNCFNDRLRELVRYANHLHDAGLLDLILATGDLVDYVYEDGTWLAPGNFDLFRRILLGAAPTTSGAPNEELRVPIFTVPGNHDYRQHPYLLYFDVSIPVFSDPTIRNYSSHNLTDGEALAIEGGQKPTVTDATAALMVQVDAADPPYFRYLNDSSSYVIRLGANRIAMLDTKQDVGVVADALGALKHWLGYSSTDENQFVGGSPNNVGIEPGPLAAVVQTAIAEAAGAGGTVIVGLHAPPINTAGEEYSHYLRETEHPTADWHELAGFLIRQDPDSFTRSPGPQLDGGLAAHPGWIARGRPGTTPYFKHGSHDDLTAAGVSTGEVEAFLKICAGALGQRPVDLVLCGHGHHNVEYRLQWDAAKQELWFFTDFYTENPAVYYPSRMLGKTGVRDYSSVEAQSYLKAVQDDSRTVHIEIQAGAPPNGQPVQISEPGFAPYWKLAVPPYATPLAGAGDPAAWWAQHRPVIMQTGGIGPLENTQRPTYAAGATLPDKPKPTFQGFRFVSVKKNVIAEIRYVSMAPLRQADYRAPWEPPAAAPPITAPQLPVFRRSPRGF